MDEEELPTTDDGLEDDQPDFISEQNYQEDEETAAATEAESARTYANAEADDAPDFISDEDLPEDDELPTGATPAMQQGGSSPEFIPDNSPLLSGGAYDSAPDFIPDYGTGPNGPKPTDIWRGHIPTFVRALAREVLLQNWASEPLKGVGRLQSQLMGGKPQDTGAYQLGERLESGVEHVMPLSPTEKQSVAGGVGKTLGDIGPLIAAGLLTGGTGGAVIGAGAVGAQMGLTGVEAQGAAAEAKGAPTAERQKAELLGGVTDAAAGLAGGAVAGKLLAPLARTAPEFSNFISTLLKNAAREGIAFTGIGEAQHYLDQQIAKQFYDPEAEYHLEANRVLTSFISGGIFGGAKSALGGGYTTAGGRRDPHNLDNPIAAEDRNAVQGTGPVNINRGVANESPPPAKNERVGNIESSPTRDSGNTGVYEKSRQERMARTPVEELEPGGVSAENSAAIGEMLKSNVEQPAQPQAAPANEPGTKPEYRSEPTTPPQTPLQAARPEAPPGWTIKPDGSWEQAARPAEPRPEPVPPPPEIRPQPEKPPVEPVNAVPPEPIQNIGQPARVPEEMSQGPHSAWPRRVLEDVREQPRLAPEMTTSYMDEAIALAKANNFTQAVMRLEQVRKLADEGKVAPGIAERAAQSFLDQSKREGLTPDVRATPEAPPVEKQPEGVPPKKPAGSYPVHDAEGNVVSLASSKARAGKLATSFRIAAEARERFPMPEVDPTTPEGIKALRDQARAAVAWAREQGWRKQVVKSQLAKPEEGAPAKTPAEGLWMDETRAFAEGRRREGQPYTAGEYAARDIALRSGDPETIDLVRADRRAQFEAGRRKPEEVEQAERTQAGGGRTPARTSEAMPMTEERRQQFKEAAGKFGRRAEDEGTFWTSRDGQSNRVKPLRSERLSEALKPDDTMFIGGKFADAYQDLAREMMAHDPNVRVHTLDTATINKIGQDTFGHDIGGFYDYKQHAVFLGEGYTPEVLLHETVHAVTSRRIESNPELKNYIRALMDHVEPKAPDSVMGRYAFKNEHEFLAVGMTSPEFQAHLASIKIDPETAKMMDLPKQATVTGRITNGFKAFVNAVRNVLGLEPNQHTALEAVVKLTDLARSFPDRTAYTVPSGKPARHGEAAIKDLFTRNDDRLKQKRAPWAMGVRDMDKVAQAMDKFFGGVAKDNPFRKVYNSFAASRVKTLDQHQKDIDHVIKDGIELDRKYAGTDEMAKLESLMHEESFWQVAGDVPFNKQGYSTRGIKWTQSRAMHPDLEARWNALPADLKDYRARIMEFYKDRHEQLTEDTALNRMLKVAGIDDRAMVDRILKGNETEADRNSLSADAREAESKLDAIRDAGAISATQGPYTPFFRRGDYAVTGIYKVAEHPNGKALDANTREFTTKADAVDFMEAQPGKATPKHYWVYDGPATPDHTPGERFYKADRILEKDGQPVMGPGGVPRTYKADVAYDKSDPHVSERWGVHVERGYLKMMDTYRDSLSHHKYMEDSGQFEKADVQPKRYAKSSIVDTATDLAALESKLRHNALYQSMPDSGKHAVKEILAEHYLQQLSATRVRNSRLHRNYVPGADEHLLQNLTSYSQDSSARLARLEYEPKITGALEEMEKAVNKDTTNSAALRAARSEFAKRVDEVTGGGYSMAAGQFGPGMHRLMNWSFMARLATPGYTIRNLTQPGLFGLPELVARHGAWNAIRTMGQVYRDLGTGRTLGQGVKETGKAFKGRIEDPVSFVDDMRSRIKDPRERDAFDHAIKHGDIDSDAGFPVAEYLEPPVKPDFRFGRSMGARQETGLTSAVTKGLQYTDSALKWMEGVSRQMPRAAETINRGVMALAAYRLEHGKNGGDHEAAKSYAGDAIRNSQFVYNDFNKPSFQRTPWARAAFQFKQFGKSAYEYLGRHMMNSIDRQASPEARSEARKALGGLFITHTMVAGALGLPWEPVRAMLIGAKTLGLTDKEWDDVETGIREAAAAVGKGLGLSATAAKTTGEAMSRGLPRLLGIDLSPGLGLDNMLLFGSPRSGTDREYDQHLMAWLFQMVGGAPGGIGLQAFSGFRDMANGDYAKGVAKLLPMKMAGDTVKATEGYLEGKKTARGRQTAPPLTGPQAVAKAVGLPPAAEAERNAYQHAVYNESEGLKTQRSKAMDAYVKASTPDERAKAANKALTSGQGITMKDLNDAATRNRGAERRSVNGVATTRQTRPIAERLRGSFNVE